MGAPSFNASMLVNHTGWQAASGTRREYLSRGLQPARYPRPQPTANVRTTAQA